MKRAGERRSNTVWCNGKKERTELSATFCSCCICINRSIAKRKEGGHNREGNWDWLQIVSLPDLLANKREMREEKKREKRPTQVVNELQILVQNHMRGKWRDTTHSNRTGTKPILLQMRNLGNKTQAILLDGRTWIEANKLLKSCFPMITVRFWNPFSFNRKLCSKRSWKELATLNEDSVTDIDPLLALLILFLLEVEIASVFPVIVQK